MFRDFQHIEVSYKAPTFWPTHDKIVFSYRAGKIDKYDHKCGAKLENQIRKESQDNTQQLISTIKAGTSSFRVTTNESLELMKTHVMKPTV